MAQEWNVNIHYDARLAAGVPARAAAVLNVGCGDGFPAARLVRQVPEVAAIDIDAPVLDRARAQFPDAKVTWCHGDVLTYPLEPASFDAVLSNAAPAPPARYPGGLTPAGRAGQGCTRLLDPNRWPLPAHPAPLAAPHGAHGSDDGNEEGSDQRISLYMTAMPDCRCCYAGQAASHRNCPPDEGELPKAAAI
jgi:SAM-dependent methyltransferase